MRSSSVFGSSSSTPSGNRLFRYEVTGLRQNWENDENDYPLRTSERVFLTVPYARMNEEMRRITRMGGQIVSIEPMTFDTESGE
ncbi:phycobilisome linker polypeptide [Oscillatoriales cyanobacterium LEGE 11467]|uniref:Phycobilisome linker polypeptide n=1 Tax=Zarconia navalis LEGE 11467 TaxID=1828826 RepID=A0A928VWN2_9CYAN|nr:phycobilisome linker polypeptide [Zarconia navalis]MBE9040653.1 phycobilisome linker polypeptide [Zarconia navalis LEGE 11467]